MEIREPVGGRWLIQGRRGGSATVPATLATLPATSASSCSGLRVRCTGQELLLCRGKHGTLAAFCPLGSTRSWLEARYQAPPTPASVSRPPGDSRACGS